MNARRLSDIALASLNVVFLTTTALALVTASAWLFLAPRVDELGRTLWDAHVREPQHRLTAAIADLEQGRAESGALALEALLAELDETRPGDRLARVKVAAYRALATYDAQASRFADAAFWLDQWLAFDPRNLDVQVERATLLRRMPERAGEADRLIRELHERFPEAASVARAYSELTADETSDSGGARNR